MQQARPVGPALGDLDKQLQKDLAAKKGFQSSSGGLTDFLEPDAAPADHNRLLRDAFDVDRGPNNEQRLVGSLGELFDNRRCRIRDFLLGVEKELLADHLLGQHPFALIGQFIARIQGRTDR